MIRSRMRYTGLRMDVPQIRHLEYSILNKLNLKHSTAFLLEHLRSHPSAGIKHWKQDMIYVFPEMKLRGLVPNFHVHVSAAAK